MTVNVSPSKKKNQKTPFDDSNTVFLRQNMFRIKASKNIFIEITALNAIPVIVDSANKIMNCFI